MLIRNVDRDRVITIIERAPEVGGLLRPMDCGEWGKFDQGMHTFTTSTVPELNASIEGLLPASDWIYLADKRRDLSGLFFEGRLQHHCHYPDLRFLPDEIRRLCAGDLLFALSTRDVPVPQNMEQFGQMRFGEAVTRSVIEPTLRKLYGREPAAIDPIVAKLLPLDRVALLDEDVFAKMLPVDLLRSRIAYPEQRNLPLQYSSGHFSFYPKAFGAYRLVDAIVARLAAAGVRLMTDTTVSDLVVEGGAVSAVIVSGDEGTSRIEADKVYWTAGALPLARALRLPLAQSGFEGPKIAAVTNVLIDRPPNMGDLYYFWCFDPDYCAFRVTNFVAFCPQAIRRGGYPVSIEFFLDPEVPKDAASLAALAFQELNGFGVIDAGTEILCSASHVLPVGFPILSCQNRSVLESLRAAIGSASISNLFVTGIQAEWGVVFQPDVLVHTYRTVNAAEGQACL